MSERVKNRGQLVLQRLDRFHVQTPIGHDAQVFLTKLDSEKTNWFLTSDPIQSRDPLLNLKPSRKLPLVGWVSHRSLEPETPKEWDRKNPLWFASRHSHLTHRTRRSNKKSIHQKIIKKDWVCDTVQAPQPWFNPIPIHPFQVSGRNHELKGNESKLWV